MRRLRARQGLQVPPLQVLPTSHATPQAPQLALSLFRSLQTLLAATHSGRFGWQVHTELLQVEPDWQIVPHPPQFFGSELVSVQVPGTHSRIGGAPQEHVPVVQTFPPVHEIAHAPQLSVLVCVSTQLPTQLVSDTGDGEQVAAHAPRLQT